MQKIVLLSGPLAVGKTHLRNALVAKHGFEIIRSSAYLADIAGQIGRPADRRNLQEIGDRLDVDTDFRWLVDQVALPLLARMSNQARWVVDAVRKSRQVEHFRKEFGARIIHVHLIASENALRARYYARNGEGPTKDGAPYEIAIDHDNERQSRALSHIADLVIDTEMSTPQDLLLRVVNAVSY